MTPRWVWLLLPLAPLVLVLVGMTLPFAIFWFAFLGVVGGVKATGSRFAAVFRRR